MTDPIDQPIAPAATTNEDLAQDIQNFSDNTPSNDDLAAAIASLATNSGTQVAAIEGLRESIHEETSARENKTKWIQRVLVVVAAAVVLLLALTVALGVTIKQQNDAAKERSTTASDQRAQQAAVLAQVVKAYDDSAKQLDAAAATQRDTITVTNWCAVSAKDLTAYKACLAPFGITYPTKPFVATK